LLEASALLLEPPSGLPLILMRLQPVLARRSTEPREQRKDDFEGVWRPIWGARIAAAVEGCVATAPPLAAHLTDAPSTNSGLLELGELVATTGKPCAATRNIPGLRPRAKALPNFTGLPVRSIITGPIDVQRS
jgi:hypothetical protein